MSEVQGWIMILAGIAIAFIAWRISINDKSRKIEQDERLLSHEQRLGWVETRVNKLTVAESEHITRRLELSGKIKDLTVEVHNFQDHLARNDRDVIDLNRTFSKLRPIHKIVLPRDPIIEKQKTKSKSRAH